MYCKYAANYMSVPKSIPPFAGCRFYWNMFRIVYFAGKKTKKGIYTGDDWVADSMGIADTMESIGAKIVVEGYENLQGIDGPCVIVSNHMSTLETMLLPCIIQPVKDATFVVKNTLLKYPAMGGILQAREAIVVGRENPRKDLQLVLEEGEKHLKNGRSIIIFPQGTRRHDIDPEHFNTLGEKLARRADVPVIPVAIKTDAWGTGKVIKDFGKIDPCLPIHVRFGTAKRIAGNGKEEHKENIDFIMASFAEFTAEAHKIAGITA